MTALLAVDPALNSPGAALFLDRVLHAAAKIPDPGALRRAAGRRARLE